MTREAAAQRLGRWNAAVATNVSRRGARAGVENRNSYSLDMSFGKNAFVMYLGDSAVF